VDRPHRIVRPVLLLALLVVAGCGAVVPGRPVPAEVPSGDLALVRDYVQASNRAADAGPQALAAFLRDTQERGTPPPPARCFGDYALRTRLVERTLRPAPEWQPPAVVPGAGRPSGAVYVVAASVTALREGAVVREDVGSKHLVIRDGRVYSYAPCPN
jgi:hypothetical protein